MQGIKPLHGFLPEEEYAESMGIDIRLFRMMILFLACSLAGMITAMAGPVAFSAWLFVVSHIPCKK